MQAQPHRAPEILLIANQGDCTLSFLDINAGKGIATVPVGDVTGHEVAVSPDFRTAFVPIYGDSGVGRPGTDGSTMAVIDIASRTVRQTVSFGEGVRPHCAIYDIGRDLLYVTTELRNSVSIVDPRSLKVIGEIPTGAAESHMLAVSHDGRRGYTANVGPGTVSVLDMDAHKTITVIPISRSVQRISISRDGRWVFTSDQAKPQLAVIDTFSNHVSSWIPLPSIGYGTASTADGRYLLVTMRDTNAVAVVDLTSKQVARSIEVGKTPVQILIQPDGAAAFVSCTDDGTVAVLETSGDPAHWQVSRAISAGKLADGMAWVR